MEPRECRADRLIGQGGDMGEAGKSQRHAKLGIGKYKAELESCMELATGAEPRN